MFIRGLKGELDRHAASKEVAARHITRSKKLLSLALTFIQLAPINFMKQNVWQAFLDTFVFITFF